MFSPELTKFLAGSGFGGLDLKAKSLIYFFESMTDGEVEDFANKLLSGYRPCPKCGLLYEKLYRVPTKVTKNFERHFEGIARACEYCISRYITEHNENQRRSKEKELKEEQGYVEVRRWSFDERQMKGGFVYIAWHRDNIYKIGASVNPINRLASLGYKERNFKLALRTLYHFDLEKFLHIRFKKQKERGELFVLDGRDINFIRNIKSITVVYDELGGCSTRVDNGIKCFNSLARLEDALGLESNS